MPRPRILEEEGVILPIYIPKTLKYILEEIANQEGKSVSQLVREIIANYLTTQYRAKFDPMKVKIPQSGGIDPKREIENRYFNIRLKELLLKAEGHYKKAIEILKWNINKSTLPIEFHEHYEKVREYVDEIVKIIKKINNPPSKITKKILELMTFIENPRKHLENLLNPS